MASLGTIGGSNGPTERLSAAERREALLDIALDLLVRDGEPAVTIGAVAERAAVTRTLVYKHFENRDDLIVALHRREAERLDHDLVALVTSTPGGFEPKFRAMVRGVLAATDQWGTIFNPLARTAAGTIGRREARTRNRRTISYYARLAAQDYGLDRETAELAVAVQLGGIDALMWRTRPGASEADRDRLVDAYTAMTVGALGALAE